MRSLLKLLLALPIIFTSCKNDSWETFQSQEGGFVILVPKIPSMQVMTVNTEIGPLDLHYFQIDLFEEEKVAYGVTYSDYPESLIDNNNPAYMLDGARDECVKGMQGELLLELIISIDGYPGRELRVLSASGNYIFIARVFLVNNRIYSIVVETAKERRANKNNSKFLDSFELRAYDEK